METVNVYSPGQVATQKNAALSGAKLVAGQAALDFTATDIYGDEFRLSDYKGQKILLSFYRNVNCPFCNRRVHKLMTRSLQLKKSGIQVVFMFESSNDKLSSSTFHQGIAPWPLIGDPDKNVYSMYGIENSLLKVMRTHLHANFFKVKKETKDLNLPEDKDATQTLIPADFFINEDFIIERAHYGRHLDDHADFSIIKEFAGLAY